MKDLREEKKQLTVCPLRCVTKTGKSLLLRPICEADATARYRDWMNDYEIVRYTESRFYTQTIESLRNWIIGVDSSPSEICFAIFSDNGEKKLQHIGNIKLDVNARHNCGDIGLIIGEKTVWGSGVATAAIRAVTEYGLRELGLHRMYAGIYEPNTASRVAFIRAGFSQASYIASKYLFENSYIGAYEMHIFNDHSGCEV